ncbi:uncharacterized protein N7506_005252 [Penicillium brevicompactum]|uniref:uncharacterized protein n=1 Tax=Penicillium brevicompactum TaxID=5074 RepID=UPI002541F347|nr:uncharacterized protein N7506_005252 [Penicillium brevicompactum]KAJ5337230.1 hypothetical protein N7506_005252 [Penicillium brevicompactum]
MVDRPGRYVAGAKVSCSEIRDATVGNEAWGTQRNSPQLGGSEARELGVILQEAVRHTEMEITNRSLSGSPGADLAGRSYITAMLSTIDSNPSAITS